MNDTDQSAETDDATPRRRRWVWYAGWNEPESDATSVLAIVETVLAVGLYWWAAVHFETYWFLFTGIAAVPLLLLRSPQSQELGIRWFDQWLRRPPHKYSDLSPSEKGRLWVGFLIAPALAFATAYFLVPTVVLGVDDVVAGHVTALATDTAFVLPRMLLAMAAGALLGVGAGARVSVGAVAGTGAVAVLGTVAGAVAGATTVTVTVAVTVAATLTVAGVIAAATASNPKSRAPRTYRVILSTPFLSVLAFGLGLGTLMASIMIRVTASMRHVLAGIQHLPENYARLLWSLDSTRMPELMPNLPRRADIFTLPGFVEGITNKFRSAYWFDNVAAVALMPMAVLWFLPGWLYRISLKSTAWFWWPLAFLLRPPVLAHDPGAFHWRTLRSLRGLGGLVMALATIGGFLFVHLVLNGAIGEGNPFLTVAGYLFAIDWTGIAPWQALLLAGACLTVVIAVQVNFAHGLGRHAKTPAIKQSAERWWKPLEYLTRLRVILMVLYFTAVSAQMLLYFNSRDCRFRVPRNVQAWIDWTYGDRAPNQSKCRWPA